MESPKPRWNSSRVRGGITFVSLLIAAVAPAGVGVWTTNGPQGGAITVVVDPNGSLYANRWGLLPHFIPFQNPLARSVDSGASWQPLSVAASPLAAGPAGTVYAASFSFLGSTAILYKSSDGGANWTTLLQKQGMNFSVMIDPFQPATMFRNDTMPPGSGELWRSTDGGISWTEVDQGLGLDSGHYVSAFAADPTTQNVFYAATAAANYPPAASLYKTTNSGESWMPLSSGFLGGTVTALAVDPLSASMYAGVSNTFTGILSVTLKSVDGGNTFQQVFEGGGAFVLDPVRPGHVYLATSSGVQVSADGGATWASMSAGLPNPISISALAIDRHGNFLHAATDTGVFDYQLAGTACPIDSRTLCLNGGRFSVTASFQQTPEGTSSPATAVPLTTDTGYFWFFDPANIELMTKVLDGCTTNGNFWFFAGGLTDVGVQISVTDTVTGATKPYSNTIGTAFQPIQDTAAFPCP